jgi:hypothetical protein
MVDKFLVMTGMTDSISPTVDNYSWTLVVDRKDPFFQVYKRDDALNCYKVIATMDATPEVAFDIMADLSRRQDWDEMVVEAETVERLDGYTRIQYVRTKAIWPTASRDLVLRSYVAKVDNRERTYVNVTKSVFDGRKPERTEEGFIRMEAGIAGQIVCKDMLPVIFGDSAC